MTTVYFRLPTLWLGELNVDESQEIASAMTLVHDPVYWRSVDMGTHGPFSTYPLLVPHVLGFPVGYASAKLMGLLMLVLGLVFMLLFFRRVMSEKLSMIGVLPVLVFICLPGADDFIAYNAEFPVALYTALSVYAIGNIILSSKENLGRCCYFSGLIIGCAPFIKMQSAPIAFSLFTFACLLVMYTRKNFGDRAKYLTTLACGCVTVTALVGVYLWYFKLFDEFRIRYLQGQVHYASGSDSWLGKLTVFARSLYYANSDSGHYFSSLLVSCFFAGIIYFLHQKFYSPSFPSRPKAEYPSNASFHGPVLIALTFVTLMSMFSIAVSGKGYEHYFLLLVFPCGFFAGSIFMMVYSRLTKHGFKISCVAAFLLITVLGPISYRGTSCSHITKTTTQPRFLL
jgi:hypothetical protein